ncbi:hypothetical protein AJ80_08516 [Polytolypa hystricis UAMH7299]|uniref:ABC transporter domain-containing protein n=1 Tax=Polytolypa hystricis (strain UAMH7299) TaxID=1447883 RepID=A0A2B7X6R8_POLH7|nr:hypothetical protein AJ80_08516 [Polytolypa hystricis UAMH7299]
MALLVRQIWTLTVKNLRITLFRHWISTPLRAFLFPVIFVIFLSYAQNFLFPSSNYGVGPSRPVRSLPQAINAVSGGRDRIIFVNGGFKGGDIERVISDVSAPLRDSKIQVKTFDSESELRRECRSSISGASRCICAAVFHSSPTEGNGGQWNYTVRADGALGTKIDVAVDNNDGQIYTLPLQHAIDLAIGQVDSRSRDGATERVISEYLFTSQTNDERSESNRVDYMGTIMNVLAVAFYISMVGVLYQMTGLIATEREIGMAQLLDTMMPNKARWQTRLARFMSHHISFSILYGPGWAITGAILGAIAFKKTSIIILILHNLISGLSLASLSIFAGGFFRKAQLSGITAVIVTLVLGIVAQITKNIGSAGVAILSLLFPPMNYVYSIILVARWESKSRGVNLVEGAPGSPSTIPLIVLWLFAILQTIIFPILGALVERKLYGASGSRSIMSIESTLAVQLNAFTKIYQPRLIQRAISCITRKQPATVHAVDNLNLQVYKGEVMVLLGSNGSGKSTTLDAIAGLHSITSGDIMINYPDAHGSFGYCPQKNVLWDDLTVLEHVKIFDSVKCPGKRTRRAELKSLIEACDLTKKISARSKNLSGGQKRKLQLAMTFTGGSSVCCIDEVSSGVDPLSRQKLWDILLAERSRRSIILTTHFLDEADILADRIAILSHGVLKASGTSVELKQRIGTGYRVHVYHTPGAPDAPLYGDVLHMKHDQETVYLPGTSTETFMLLRRLERDGIREYQVNGPTLEDVFLRVADEPDNGQTSFDRGRTAQRSSVESEAPLNERPYSKPYAAPKLRSGRRTSAFRQLMILCSKRFTILRRNPAPYLAAILIPIIAAGCSTLFLRNLERTSCDPSIESLRSNSDSFNAQQSRLVIGPRDQLPETALKIISEAPPGAVTYVDSLIQFNQEVQRQYANLTPGGFFLGEEPTFAWRADAPLIFGTLTQNLLDNMLLNVTIETMYNPLDIPFAADIGNLMIFVMYFGLSMAIYPAFLGLYPTIERLRGIRSMHYSNGVRALPLWLAYILFDLMITLIVTIVAVIIFNRVADVWFYSEYMFLIFILYGIASTLFSYVVSLFSKSQLAAFAVTAAIQAAMFLLYFIIFMITMTYVDASNQGSTLNIAFFALGVTSPVHSLSRSLYLTLNIFGVTCRGREVAPYGGAIDVFGGPILYLCLQSLLLFAILLWKESGSSFREQFRRSKRREVELEDRNTIELDAASEFSRVSRSTDDGLRVLRLRKQFKKHVAVDDVSFGVPRGECFALIGINGAGKSTCISMIRGDIQPSSRDSEIFIDGISLGKHRSKARARLGVCPQIDPLDNMTVLEHLRFYARIRGIKNPAQNIESIVQGVGLERFINRSATKLSGGNKRKLSLAIALMGNPTILLLDEPSSGMDALNKRIMWRTLKSVIPGRSLVLTTHSMEEADALASRAGIIAGKMLAAGTTAELRRRYGNSYSIQLVHTQAPHTPVVEMQRIRTWVQQQFPQVQIEKAMTYGQLRFRIPAFNAEAGRSSGGGGAGGMMSLAEVFEKLETAKVRLGVQYYSVSRATLDQVFLTVAGRHNLVEEGH